MYDILLKGYDMNCDYPPIKFVSLKQGKKSNFTTVSTTERLKKIL